MATNKRRGPRPLGSAAPAGLSRTAEYALRAMATLAELEPGESIRASELSKLTLVPLPYLSKVMRRLVLARLVDGHKGHGGGFRLARATHAISLLDVLRACAFDPTRKRCVFGWDRCDDARPCPLHPAWKSWNRAFTQWAATTSLAELDRNVWKFSGSADPESGASKPTPRKKQS